MPIRDTDTATYRYNWPHLCDTPKPGGPLTTRQPRNTSGGRVTRRHFRKSGRVSFVRGALPNYKTCISCPKQSNICNIYPNMSKNASWAHKPILIKSIIITILQLSSNSSIVDNTFCFIQTYIKIYNSNTCYVQKPSSHKPASSKSTSK